MKKTLWEITITFEDDSHVVRRVNSERLVIGSTPHSNLKLLGSDSKECAEISLDEKSGGKFLLHGKGIEVFSKGKWLSADDVLGAEIPKFRFGTQVIDVKALNDQRQVYRFEPETWVSSFKTFEDDCYALWHIRSGLLCESIPLDGDFLPQPLKAGYEFVWNPKKDATIVALREHNGDVHSLSVTVGREGALRAEFNDDVFIITKVPSREIINTLVTPLPKVVSSNRMGRLVTAVLATLLLLGSLAQLFQGEVAPTEVIVKEELSAEMTKVVLEAPKKVHESGGSAGGGGIETEKFDSRGGSGLAAVQNLLAQKATAKGEATGVLGALSALDSKMKTGKINTAGIMPSSYGQKVMGSVAGVLGALSRSGIGKGGNGVGIGGVGTKGFGGGGGGGNGPGFGTGVGNGLGKGDGSRDVIFESDNSVIRGGLDKSEVDAVVLENISQIRFCYNRGLRSNPGLQGKVISSFTIGADGGVKSSRLKDSTLSMPDVEDCIKGRVAMWKFPHPRGGGDVSVNYPFLLKAN